MFPKITKISARFDARDKDSQNNAVRALTAAFRPFGSLFQGEERVDLAEAMTQWVCYGGNITEQVRLAGKLYEIVALAYTEELSSMELARWGVTLRTPTSGTQIKLRGGGSYLVEVDFGREGSKYRAEVILNEGLLRGIMFNLYADEARVEQELVLSSALSRAEERLSVVTDNDSINYCWKLVKAIEDMARELEKEVIF